MYNQGDLLKFEKYPLFSKDKKGNLLRNYYCSDCRVGPFSEDDIRRNIFIKTGGEKQAVHFCRKCYIMKFHTTSLDNLPVEYKEREKYITSGKALEDMQNNTSKIFEHSESIIEHGVYEDEKLEITKKEVPVPEIVIEEPKAIIPEIPTPPETIQALAETMKEESDVYIHRVRIKKYESKESSSTKSIKSYSWTKEASPKEAPPIEGTSKIVFTGTGTITSTSEDFKETQGTSAPIWTSAPIFINNNLSDIIDLEKMPAREIINFVKEKTGKLITISTKSKKSIIKLANEYLKEVKVDKTQVEQLLGSSVISLVNMTAKDMVALVKEKTGQLITMSIKSKRSILRCAKCHLETKGFKVVC
jgi:hypothetical protein